MKNLVARIIGLSLLVILSMGIAPQVSLGGEPVPACETGDPIIVGPPVPGFLTFVDPGAEDQIGMVTFVGTCKGHVVTKKFCFPTNVIEGGLAAITKEHLKNLVLGDIGPPECLTYCGGEPLLIKNVSTFFNTGEKIFANVVLRFFTCPE